MTSPHSTPPPSTPLAGPSPRTAVTSGHTHPCSRQLPGARQEPAPGAQPRPAEPRSTPWHSAAGHVSTATAGEDILTQGRAGHVQGHCTEKHDLGARLCPASCRSRSSHVEPQTRPSRSATQSGLSRASELGRNTLPAGRGWDGCGRHVHRGVASAKTRRHVPVGRSRQQSGARPRGPHPSGSEGTADSSDRARPQRAGASGRAAHSGH